MAPRIEQLTEAEHQWIDAHLNVAKVFVATYSPEDANSPLTPAALDRAFSVWLLVGETDTEQINTIINAVGIAFGGFLLKQGFAWVIASDEHGSEIAMLALPGKGDVVIYPTNFVAKRWEQKVDHFLEKALTEIVERMSKLGAT